MRNLTLPAESPSLSRLALKAYKDENAAFEQTISEGTFHGWSAIVEQSEWDSLGLGQFIDPPFVVGGGSSGVAEHG